MTACLERDPAPCYMKPQTPASSTVHAFQHDLAASFFADPKLEVSLLAFLQTVTKNRSTLNKKTHPVVYCMNQRSEFRFECNERLGPPYILVSFCPPHRLSDSATRGEAAAGEAAGHPESSPSLAVGSGAVEREGYP